MTRETGHHGAVAVWLVGLLVYLLAVFHRSSMAVAGLAATDRFGISASELATFTMLQLLVYAAMQVPVGLLLDRFGSRRVMLTGLFTLTVAQTGFAFADTYALALLSRLFVGAGDAMIFICVLRLVTSWFLERRIPFVTQMTGILGQSGAIIAAVPMTLGLRHLGWTPTYLIGASVGVVLAIALVLVVHDTPEERTISGPPLSFAEIRLGLAEAWSHPGTRLGLWTHFTTQFSATTLGLLWGYPFFVRGQGLSSETAGLLLTLLVVAVMAAGPGLAWVTAHHPFHRSTMVISIVLSMVAVWTTVLVWPGNAPLWLLVLLVVVVGIGGPASMVGFDFGRTSNPAHRLGSATGIINQGGFVASLLLVVMVGLVLDWRTPGSGASFTPEAFRWAMATQYLLWGIGLTQIWRYRRRTRARLQADDPEGYARMARLA
ncbi:nitrate/nitrite transporter [Nocardioides sp.]|uniref:MFS transporter n=1 Tax=Nocardioides sp. TaxID=35761 RepID=UPI002736E818|nr:MFS transporter [Nocardioides sp.]MDP3890288.1 MFS transporter [Nocardioides sp.]